MTRRGERAPRVMVLAPSPLLTITVKARPDGPAETHLHAGGQGVRVARMLARLAVEPILCGPSRSETGAVLIPLAEREGIRWHRSPSAADNGSYIHDRRAVSERQLVACVQTVRTTSGATAVQVVRSSRRGSRKIERPGSL